MSGPSEIIRSDRHAIIRERTDGPFLAALRVLIWIFTIVLALPFVGLLLYASLHPAIAALSIVVLLLTALGTLLAAFGRAEWLLRRLVFLLCIIVAVRAVGLGSEGIGLAAGLVLLAAGGAALGLGGLSMARWVGRSYAITIQALTVLLLWVCGSVWWLNDGSLFGPVGVFVAGFALAYAISDELDEAEMG